MAWEKGGRYYYRKKRIGRRVISEYVGSGWLATLSSMSDQETRRQTAEEYAAFMAEVKAERDLTRQIAAAERETMALVKAVILASGYYKHHGQWRRRKWQTKARN